LLLEEDDVAPPLPWLCLSSVVICLLTRIFPPRRCFADDDLVLLCPVTSSLLLENIAAQRCNISLHLPLFQSGGTGGIPTDERNGRKSQFLFMAQLLRKTNLAEIFSEARSGTAKIGFLVKSILAAR